MAAREDIVCREQSHWHAKAMESPLDERSRYLRGLVLQCLESALRGHVGASFSLIELLRVLYDHILRYDPTDPDLEARDRFILSKGHGCLALYALLADKGFIGHGELDGFCRLDGMLGGHPDGTKVPGVEASTGSLGHGPAIGAGKALALRRAGNPARVFVVLGDGECNEGSVWETAMIAAQQRLDNLVLIVDYNKYQSYEGTALVQDMEPFVDKWRAFGMGVAEVNGHDLEDLRRVLSRTPLEPGRPTAIVCHTVKGKGYSPAENNLVWHHKSNIRPEEIHDIKKALGLGV